MRTRPLILAMALGSALFIATAFTQEAPPVNPTPTAEPEVQAEVTPATTAEPEVVIQGAEPTESTAQRSRDNYGNDTLSVDFPDEDIRNILRNVADLFELNVVIPDTLQGRTSIKLRDVSWRQIFQVVLSPVGFTYVEEGNIIKVVSNESLALEPVSTEVFILNYARAGDIMPTLTSLVDTAKGGKIVVDGRSNALFITELPSQMNKIRPIIEQLDKATEQVMIESKFVEVTNADIKNIGINWSSLSGMQVGVGNINQTWDRSRGQTRESIQGRSLESEDGSSDSTNTITTIGSNAGTTYSTSNTSASGTSGNSNTTNTGGLSTSRTEIANENTTTAAFATDPLTANTIVGNTYTIPNNVSTTTTVNALPSSQTNSASGTTSSSSNTQNNGTSGSTTNNLNSIVNNTISDSSNLAISNLIGIANTGGTNRMASAVFSASDFNIIISALKTQNDTKLVSNPTIVTLNNTEAQINIGKEYPIPNYTYNQERGTYEVSGFNYRPIGIILKVTPQVNARGFIKLTIEPEVSSSTESANFGTASIPIVTTRKTKTQVSLKDGYTMGIGGLIENSVTTGQTKVPVLGSVPLLGRLFRSDSKNDQMRNLIIFITAKTVPADGAPIEEVFDPRRVRQLQMQRSDLPGYRDGSDPFFPEGTVK